jgi:hypothetical protein
MFCQQEPAVRSVRMEVSELTEPDSADKSEVERKWHGSSIMSGKETDGRKDRTSFFVVTDVVVQN